MFRVAGESLVSSGAIVLPHRAVSMVMPSADVLWVSLTSKDEPIIQLNAQTGALELLSAAAKSQLSGTLGSPDQTRLGSYHSR